MRPFPRLPSLVALLAAFAHSVRADVVINEIMAAASDRLLQWDANGVPRLGTGTEWQAPVFDDTTWPAAPGPFGFGFSAPTVIGTNVATQMQYLTPTLYLRRAFVATAADVGQALELAVQYNDGFIAYLNGVEVARHWAGPRHQFNYHDQPAYNPNLATTPAPSAPYSATIALTGVSLVEGTNVLAIHALNLSSTSANFYAKADLRVTGAATNLVNGSDTWRYFPGVVEPSGALYDPALLSSGRLNVPWGRVGFDEAGWSSGVGPIGAASGAATTNVTGVIGQTPSIYLRTTFNVSAADAALADALQLLVDYDDGFIAYINGVEVVRANMADPTNPNTFTPRTAVAFRTRNNGTTTAFALEAVNKLLVPGANVLAIQVHNVAINDSDLFLKADLRSAAPSSRTFVASNTTWKYLRGLTEPVPEIDGAIEESPELPDSATDWIELHNNGATAVSLNGWSLTDDAAKPKQWVFPDVTIPAGGYLVVVCDGENLTTNPRGFLHTNFKLDADGEFLGLYDSSGTLVQNIAPAFPRQSPFHSYGRDDGGGFVYFDTPTPAAANAATGLAGFVQAPGFGTNPGFYTSAQTVTLTSTPGATIQYTTDGRDPAPGVGTTYMGPLTFSASIGIRARAFQVGMVPSDVTSGTFLINESSARRSLPAVSLIGDPQRSLYRPFGIMAIQNNLVGTNYASTGQPWTSNNDPLQYHNPGLRGRFMERPVGFEFLYPNNAPGAKTELGLRISGSNHARPRYILSNQNSATPNALSWSTTDYTQKPSFNLFFRNDLGGDPFEFPLFPGSAVTKFHDLRFRAGKNELTNGFVKDELMRRLSIDTGQVGSHGIFTTLFVNGNYKGYYNLVEHMREEFFQRWYGSDFEWDVRQVGDIASGDSIAFQEMLTFLRKSPQNSLVNYQAMKTRLDVVNFIDYLLVNLLGVTGDWPHNNFVAARERSVNGVFRYFLWDAEGAFGGFSGNVRTNQFVTGTTGSIISSDPVTPRAGEAEGIRVLYTLLRTSPEFRLLFADRIQKHFFNGGALTETNVISRHNALRTQMLPLIPGISDAVTPWMRGTGDISRYTLSGGSTGSVINNPSRRRVLFDGYIDDTVGGSTIPAHFVAEQLWPSTRAPSFSQHGGAVTPNYSLTITNAPENVAGIIYYTTTGADPRGANGVVAPGAEVYSGPITISHPTQVLARVLLNNVWSPVIDATFLPPQTAPLLISEIMYNPPAQGAIDGDEFEFLEIKNVGASPVSLNGVRFTAGITFQFASGSTLLPGGFAVLVKNRAQFARKYPNEAVAGVYGPASSLNNAGEALALADLSGATVFAVTYDDTAPWPTGADDGGYSLVPVNPNANPAPSDPLNWRQSTLLGGSPGADDATDIPATLYLNELLANPAAGQKDAVEIWNPGAQPANVGHWYLSDNAALPKKYRIPGDTTIQPDGYLVVTADEFNATPGQGSSFELPAIGGQVVLTSADSFGSLSGYTHRITYGVSDAGVSFGRHLTSISQERFVAESAVTLGAANAGPRVGPVVITEVMYHQGSGKVDYVEIRNVSSAPVELFDPANPANTWRLVGLEFSFPEAITLQPRQIAIVAQGSPDAFRASYGVPAGVAVFECSGALANVPGELIALQKPAPPLAGQTLAFIDVDTVFYRDSAPWPIEPNGTGPSLERKDLQAFADDPVNWRASVAGGTPAAMAAITFVDWQNSSFSAAQLADPAISGTTADADRDGISNFREWAHGLDPLTPNGAEAVSSGLAMDGADGPFLTLRFRRNLSAQGARFHVDTASELPSWIPDSAVVVGAPVNHGDGTDTVTMRDTVPSNTGVPRRFIRLRVTGD